MKLIPKVAYFYWGKKTLSYLRYMTLYSFRKVNPEWKMEVFYSETPSASPVWRSCDHVIPTVSQENFWGTFSNLNITITPIESLPLNFPEAMSDVMKSDFLRLYLLSERGGLWSDMDILYFRPVETAFAPSNSTGYFCKHALQKRKSEKHPPPPKYHLIGFLMGAPGNPHFTSLYKKCMDFWNPKVYQSLGAHLYKHNVNMCLPDVINIPLSVVYPSNRIEDMFTLPASALEGSIGSQTIGWHWFGGNPIAGYYQNFLTSAVCNSITEDSGSIITTLIRRIQNV